MTLVEPLSIAPAEHMNIVAFTEADEFSALGDKSKSFPYQRVVALWYNDGFFGQHIGERDTSGCDERALSLSPKVASRLMTSFSAILEGQEVNCHRFAREITGMPSSNAEPVLAFSDLPIVRELSEGSLGIICVEDCGIPHSIGYGLGEEGLQVMSCGGKLGFAKNDRVLDLYRRLYPNHTVNLRQAP